MAKILVVEDNVQNLKLATVILTSAGHTVIPAHDAAEAERSLAAELPDLVLMDLALPGKDGYTMTRELRQRPETAKLPVLAVSSFAMRGDAERALAAGCTAYLTKPIRRVALLEHVDALLGVVRPAPAATAATTEARPTSSEPPPSDPPTTDPGVPSAPPVSEPTTADPGAPPPAPPPDPGPTGGDP
jgi:two-component system cell cycle response regulator DivK